MQFLAGSSLGASITAYVAYENGVMANAPLWFKIAAPVFCEVMLFIWFLQCRSADKTSYTPKIW